MTFWDRSIGFSTRTLTRGIFVPEWWSGYACVAFYLISKAFVALICARIIVINGVDRFSAQRPEWLCRLLADPDAHGEGKAIVISLLPALATFAYLFGVGRFEHVHTLDILGGLTLGTAIAIIFWYVLNAWYYLAYENPAPKNDSFTVLALGENAARTILFPRHCFFLNRPGTVLVGRRLTLEDMKTPLRDSWIAKKSHILAAWLNYVIGLPGYIHDGNMVYEAHVFSAIALTGFLIVYWLLYPLIAPVPTTYAIASFAFLLIGLGFVLWIFLRAESETSVMRRWKYALSASAIVFCGLIPYLWYISSPDRFPTLAVVLLIIILLGWTLCALSFFFDRFRVPVLTLFVLAAVVLRVVAPGIFYRNQEEHYISTEAPPSDLNVPTPAAVFTSHLLQDDGHPLIVITATGGGLHASAWTARVLREIDARFQDTERETFRSHILLMSTVSGSSVAAGYYLQEVQKTQNKDPNLNKVVIASECSSLEAVGWGLLYYDLPKAIVPFAGWAQPSTGESDLSAWRRRTPIGKDRTWALRQGILRNANDPYCYASEYYNVPEAEQKDYESKHRPGHESLFNRLIPSGNVHPQTLSSISASGIIPAFTMNTTTAEGGDRFLLANYRLPKYSIGPVEGPPAESFLDLHFDKGGSGTRADLPLASAAQMSATFPYV